VADQRDRLGSSGVFKLIVDVSRRVKRAISEPERELSPEAEELASVIAQLFVAGRFADVHALMTPALQAARPERFEARWSDAVQSYGVLTGFEIADAGRIDLAFIPGLEEVPQSQFVAFVEISFSSPEVALGDDKAFTVGAVLLDHIGDLRIGALHLR
jgi:hypothetical protein